jgi:hypothetical protein
MVMRGHEVVVVAIGLSSLLLLLLLQRLGVELLV